MRKLGVRILLVTVAAVAVVSCSPGSVRVGASAVDETARVLNVAAEPVELSAGQVSALASQVDVSDDVVRSVAPQLDSQPVWSRAVTRVRDINRATDGQIRDVALSVACDAFKGEITSREELRTSLWQQLEGLSQDELHQLVLATEGLYEDLLEASRDEDPETRAAVVVLCYLSEEIGG